MSEQTINGITRTKIEEIRNDRWFKLKWDKFICKQDNSSLLRWHQNQRQPILTPWYELAFQYDQVSQVLSKGTKYTSAEIEAFIRDQQACAKMEVLLMSGD